MNPTDKFHPLLKIYESLPFSLSISIYCRANKNYRAYLNTYRSYVKKFNRKGDAGWHYWNGMIQPWAHLLYKKNVTFETNWTLQNITQMKFLFEQLMKILFLDYSNYKCVNNAYQDFVRKFYLKLINTKPWFDINVLNAIPNCDKHYRKFKQSGKKMTKAVSSVQNFYLKK